MAAMHIPVDSDAVEGALAEYLRTTHEDEPDVAAAAQTHHALPFWKDIGGCLFLHPTGAVLTLGWDTPSVVEPVEDTPHDRNLVHAARASAAERFPSISGLRPERGPNARTCPGCGGTGRLSAYADRFKFLVCQCGGLGWLPE